jgi:4-hydroxythreonine-4-phosphate dehydrogenase
VKPIILTYGMGIGPEVSLQALQVHQSKREIILMGRRSTLQRASEITGIDLGSLSIEYTSDDEETAEVCAIRMAAKRCMDGHAAAMVTGPIHKEKLVRKGFEFSGHTDFLQNICVVPQTVMSFVGGDFKVCLVTTHVPLMQVASNLSIDKIVDVVRIADTSFKRDLGLDAHFAVCGLNPHSGEGGVLGREEIEIINPACELLRNKGCNITGPISAETAFLLAKNKKVDVVIAMFHDQGLVPLKVRDFGRSVNWTLGLPFIRTSVDHGTADHLIGTGTADSSSMCAALNLAEDILGYRIQSSKTQTSHSSTFGKSPQISSPQ